MSLDQGEAKIFNMDNTRKYIHGKILVYNEDIGLIMEAQLVRSPLHHSWMPTETPRNRIGAAPCPTLAICTGSPLAQLGRPQQCQ